MIQTASALVCKQRDRDDVWKGAMFLITADSRALDVFNSSHGKTDSAPHRNDIRD